MSSKYNSPDSQRTALANSQAVPDCTGLPFPASSVVAAIKTLAATMRKEIQSNIPPDQTLGQQMIKVKIGYLCKTHAANDMAVSSLCAELHAALHDPEQIIILCENYLAEQTSTE